MHVFHVIGTCETILMSRLFVVALSARVPIFHIESAHVARVLIGKRFEDVGVFQKLLLERWMGACGDVRDHASIWDGQRHWVAATSTATFPAGTSAATTSTTTSTP